MVLFTDEALEDWDDADGAIDPLGILGGVLTFSVTSSFVFFASSEELMQCISGFQFDSSFRFGICIGGIVFRIFGNINPGQNRVVCSDELHLTHVIWPFDGCTSC